MGPMQGQDYEAALWAIGLRCVGKARRRDVEESIRKREITRTWLLRGTLHMAASEDIRWMIGPIRQRLKAIAGKREENLGLGGAVVEKAEKAMEEALRGGNILTRGEMYRIMEETGVPTGNNLGYHMLYRAAWDGLICMGPQQGREQTFVLLDEWVLESRSPGKGEALGEMAATYFSGHGPATWRDFAWWSGLRATEAKEAIDAAGTCLKKLELGGNTYYSSQETRADDGSGVVTLLPAFDEYILGYSDRSLLTGDGMAGEAGGMPASGYIHSNGVFLPTVVWDGRVTGTWKRQASGKAIRIIVRPFAGLERELREGIGEAAAAYGEFLEKDVMLKFSGI